MMNDINKWFYSLTLNELHQYIMKLEVENEKLVKELDTSSKLNRILENIAKSTQTGYSLLRRIEINKNCECNEHMNQSLRKSLNESINDTNLLLKHFQMIYAMKGQPMDECEPSSHTPPVDPPVVDISDDHSTQSPVPLCIRNSVEDKDSSTSSTSPHSSGYESNDYSADRPTHRTPDFVFHRNYSTGTIIKQESHSPTANMLSTTTSSVSAIDEDMPQNLSKRKSPEVFSPAVVQTTPIVQTCQRSTSRTSPPTTHISVSTAGAVAAIDGMQHLPNKCSECDLSFNLKPSLDQHLLTHVSPTFTVQRAGRGRPAKNDSRVLRVTDSDLNILRMNDAFGKLPEGLISLSALEELRRHKFTGFGRYRCPWPDCGYTPHFLRDLRRHMFKHTGDKKYKCDFDGCDFITVWKTSLLQHQRKKHNMVPDPHSTGTTNPTPIHINRP